MLQVLRRRHVVAVALVALAGLATACPPPPAGDPGGPAPTIAWVAPSQGPASGGAEVTIAGDDLAGVTSVRFGGVAAAFVVVSDSVITATTPAHAPGLVDVVVARGGASDTAEDAYTFRARPTITGLSPTSGPAIGGTTVTVTGTGLSDAGSVNFNATPAASITVVSDTQLSIVTPAHPEGGSVVTVTTWGGTSEPVPAAVFTFTGPAT